MRKDGLRLLSRSIGFKLIEPLLVLQIEVSVFRSQPGDWAVCGQRSDTSSQAVQALVGECDTGGAGGFGDAGGDGGSGDAGGAGGSTRR